jgi:membrane-associated PAP2 superfamily phosphatase
MTPVAALTTLVMLVLVTPAAAAPLIPAAKSAQCPFGYMQSGGYCVPMSRFATAAAPKVGKCPRGYGQSGNSCFDLRVR